MKRHKRRKCKMKWSNTCKNNSKRSRFIKIYSNKLSKHDLKYLQKIQKTTHKILSLSIDDFLLLLILGRMLLLHYFSTQDKLLQKSILPCEGIHLIFSLFCFYNFSLTILLFNGGFLRK